MSLITEALRRTQDASLPAAPPPPPVLPVAPPVIPATHERKLHLWIVLIVVALFGAGVGAYVAFRPAPPVVVKPTEPVAPAPVVKKEIPPPAPVVAEQPKPEPPPAPVQEPVKPVRELPKLTLQGITHDKSGAEALINNWNVHVGDDVEGARVTAIETGIVKLEFDGKKIVLRLR